MEEEKSMQSTIDAMKVGDSIKLYLSRWKYASIQVTLSRKRLEGWNLESRISADRSFVIVTRRS